MVSINHEVKTFSEYGKIFKAVRVSTSSHLHHLMIVLGMWIGVTIVIFSTTSLNIFGYKNDKSIHEKIKSVVNIAKDRDDSCTQGDQVYQSLSDIRPSCNEVHSMGLTLESLVGSQSSISYHETGAFNSVWLLETALDDRIVMKTHLLSRDFSPIHLDRNRRDASVSEKAGRPPNNQLNNLLPIYHYCAFTSVAPYATVGTLDKYVQEYPSNNNGQAMDAIVIFHLALQAARGVYQSHLYFRGKATHVHADVKPSQFLLFDHRWNDQSGNLYDRRKYVPILQINDFNRGRFLKISSNNQTCPFKICHIKHKGSRYRSPEEYSDCAYQTDSIDVFSLGSIFFFLLSDGLPPFYHIDNFDRAMNSILEGKLPHLPKSDEYHEFGVETTAFVTERVNHPAYNALVEIMRKCWTFKAEDRPSALEVVNMLERQLHNFNLLQDTNVTY